VRVLPLRPSAAVGKIVVGDATDNFQTLDRFVAEEPVDGLIIVRRGVIVYERYPRMAPADRHLMFSVTKAFVGTLAARLEDQGRIDFGKPVETYLPELQGTAWAGISVRDVADMASGMDAGEDAPDAYTSPIHPIFQMEAALGWQPMSPGMPAAVTSGDAYGFLRTVKRTRDPGVQWTYASTNSLLLGEIAERVTADHDATLLVNARGFPVAHAGMSSTLRDLARFGLLFTPSGRAGPSPVVSDGYLRRLVHEGRPQLLKTPHPAWDHHAAYQWDQITEQGLIVKGGFGGQILMVDTQRDIVIAMFGTNPDQTSPPPQLPHRLAEMVDAVFQASRR
jgi:CubicO group peptidase (beta-lactamase class C family)